MMMIIIIVIIIRMMIIMIKIILIIVVVIIINHWKHSSILCKKKKVLSLYFSPPEVFLGKSVLKIWRKFTGEHSCRSNGNELGRRTCKMKLPSQQ